MNETLNEYVDSRGVPMGVDRRRGIIRGVKILGVESRNGRIYLPEAIRDAAPLYEEAKVNVNHPQGDPAAPRDYQDRIGVIRNVVCRPGEGLFAEFHFNPKHALAEQLLWDAEHAPENVGFSHNVQARTSRRGEQTVVETIAKVQSVDLVADPATTGGLFEGAGEEKGVEQGAEPKAAGDREEAPLAEQLTLEQLRRQCPHLVEELLAPEREETARLRAELDRLRAEISGVERRRLARQMLVEAGLPDPDTAGGSRGAMVGERFVRSLLEAADEATMRQLIEERVALIRGVRAAHGDAAAAKPVCREQWEAAAAGGDVKSFVESIT